jgi:hypothetical protein
MRQRPNLDPKAVTVEAATIPSRLGDSPVLMAPEKAGAGGGYHRCATANQRSYVTQGRREEAVLISRRGATNGCSRREHEGGGHQKE